MAPLGVLVYKCLRAQPSSQGSFSAIRTVPSTSGREKECEISVGSFRIFEELKFEELKTLGPKLANRRSGIRSQISFQDKLRPDLFAVPFLVKRMCSDVASGTTHFSDS